MYISGGTFFLFLVWFRVWHSSVQPLFISFNSCCSICPPWRMMWPYCIVEVDNFWSGLFPSVAQLSSDFHYFSCFPVVQQILSLTWMVLTIFCLRGAHRPQPQWRWYFRQGLKWRDTHSEWHIHRDLDIMTTAAHRAASVVRKNIDHFGLSCGKR